MNYIGTRKIKQYRIWLCLLMKRLLRQPAFICLLVLIPVMGYAVSILEQEGSSGAVVAVCVESSEWSGQITKTLEGLSVQNRQGGILQYEFYENDMAIEQAVLRSKADCGFVIPGDITERVKEGDWRRSILVYETESSSITGMAKERIAGVIFKLYSEQRYKNYMEETIQSEDSIQAYETDEVVAFAREAYETHLADGSTFSFLYEEQDNYIDDSISQQEDDTIVGNDTSVFPLKGVFGVLIFISGMCGMLEYEKDKKEKRFLRVAPNWMTYIVNIWIPTLYTSLAVLICLWLTDALQCMGGYGTADDIADMRRALLQVWTWKMWVHQIAYLIIYQCIIVAYCSILRVILHRQETIAVSIPILALGSLVCAPVFIRLAMYMPLFKVMEMLFPVTYYLML